MDAAAFSKERADIFRKDLPRPDLLAAALRASEQDLKRTHFRFDSWFGLRHWLGRGWSLDNTDALLAPADAAAGAVC